MQEHILSWITFLPLIGMGVILFVPKTSVSAIKGVALVATGLPLVLATYLYFGMFDKASADLQFVERAPWIEALKVEYFVAVDGLSLALVWLTALLLFIGVPASFGITKAQKSYYALLLLLEVGILGVFVSQDYFLFYVFWEIMLLPMYFLIGIWGGPAARVRRDQVLPLHARRLGPDAHRDRRAALDMGSIEGVTAPFSIPEMTAMAQQGLLTGASLPFGGALLGMKFTTGSSGSCSWASPSRCRCSRSTPGCRTPTSRRPRRSPSSWPASC